MFAYRAIGGAVFIHAQPNQKRCFDCGCEKSDRVQCRNSVTKHFKQSRRGSQSCHAEMNWQQHAVQKPRRYRCRADQHTRISSEQHSEDRRAKNENARRDAKTLVECARKNLMRMQFKRDQTGREQRTRRTRSESRRPSTWPIAV